jgi:hypothetical protein
MLRRQPLAPAEGVAHQDHEIGDRPQREQQQPGEQICGPRQPADKSGRKQRPEREQPAEQRPGRQPPSARERSAEGRPRTTREQRAEDRGLGRSGHHRIADVEPDQGESARPDREGAARWAR